MTHFGCWFWRFYFFVILCSILLFTGGNAEAIDFGVGKNVFTHEFVDGPVEAYFERTPTATTWQMDFPKYGSGIRQTLPTTPNGSAIGKTIGVGAGTGAGAGAFKARVAIPVGATGKTLLVDLVKNIPKSNIAPLAVKLLKGIGPWTIVPIIADWAVQAGLGLAADGSLTKTVPPPSDQYYPSSTVDSYLRTHSCPPSSFAPPCTGGTQSAYSTYNNASSVSLGWKNHNPPNSCYAGYAGFDVYNACTTINPQSPPSGFVPSQGTVASASDSDAESALNGKNPSDPGGALNEIVSNGGLPAGDTTVASGPSTVAGDTSTVTHPGGSQTVTTNTYNVTYNNNIVSITNSTTTTEKDAQGNTTSQTTESKPPQENADLCKVHPEIIACSRLGEAEKPDQIQSKQISVSITPVSMPGGSCPPDMATSFLGHSITWSWALPCQFASGMSGIVIAMAWLGAGLIVIGGVKD